MSELFDCSSTQMDGFGCAMWRLSRLFESRFLPDRESYTAQRYCITPCSSNLRANCIPGMLIHVFPSATTNGSNAISAVARRVLCVCVLHSAFAMRVMSEFFDCRCTQNGLIRLCRGATVATGERDWTMMCVPAERWGRRLQPRDVAPWLHRACARCRPHVQRTQFL